ncbi:transcriptional regulator, MarR family [Jatrophihabitans endophyticus]|uniref:Transcriptional regulator, MarR family n=1 Tax=Jatrophihabitans endophyticus TaxID=1206085 RepID=A0A1M5H7H1_9ACTN|nr:MarR family transcriptional regulator [Jatrophihabitans endophyticus]SHG11858.1 transcriptional regulator, MarR family [Jatrophihabitans endophyticus]
MNERRASGGREATDRDVRWLSDAEQRAWRAFLEMQARLNAQLNRELQETSGLSSADFAVLVTLSEHPDGRVRVLELARGLQWEKSRLSHQLTRMQQRGLVDRSYCSEDRRGAFIVLTDAGRRAVEAAAPTHVAGVRRYLFDGLDERQVAALDAISRGTLDRIAAACAGHPDPIAAECDGAGAVTSADTTGEHVPPR